jgi:hypothetical protein
VRNCVALAMAPPRLRNRDLVRDTIQSRLQLQDVHCDWYDIEVRPRHPHEARQPQTRERGETNHAPVLRRGHGRWHKLTSRNRHAAAFHPCHMLRRSSGRRCLWRITAGMPNRLSQRHHTRGQLQRARHTATSRSPRSSAPSPPLRNPAPNNHVCARITPNNHSCARF